MIRPCLIAIVALTCGNYIIYPFFLECPMPDVAVRLIAALGYSVVRKGGMGKERGDLLCRPVEGREGGSRWSPGREKGIYFAGRGNGISSLIHCNAIPCLALGYSADNWAQFLNGLRRESSVKTMHYWYS